MSQQRIWSERQHVCHKKTKSQSPVYIDKIYNSCERARGEQSQTKWQKSKVRVSKTAWTNKTQEERQRYFRRFRNFVPKDKLTATSTDGKMTVIKPRSHGRKIGQRKRKINERSTTIKKQKTFSDDSEWSLI